MSRFRRRSTTALLVGALVMLPLVSATCTRTDRVPGALSPSPTGTAQVSDAGSQPDAEGPGTVGSRPDPAGPDASAPSPEPKPSALLYAEQTDDRLKLERRPLQADTSPQTVLEVGMYEAVGQEHAGGRIVLFIERDERPEIGGDHFAAEPHLQILDREGHPVADLGVGRAPDLSPDGRTLVYAKPTEVRTCLGDEPHGCELPPARIAFAPVDGSEPTHETDPQEAVDGVAWASLHEALVLRRDRDPLLVKPDGTTNRLRLRGRWEAVNAATERLLVSTHDLTRLHLQDLTGRVLWSRSVAPARANHAWSPDGRRILLQLVEPRGDGLADTRLELVDARTGDSRPLTEDRANGTMLWSPGSGWFAYRREASGGGFELIVCEAKTRSCEHPVFSWQERIQLLAIEP